MKSTAYKCPTISVRREQPAVEDLGWAGVDATSRMSALMQDSRDGDFGAAMEQALDEYREDTAPEGPNQAQREFWPSTYRYGSILYRIGKQLGGDGAIYLDRIPDDDLRLFAEIEFEAA